MPNTILPLISGVPRGANEEILAVKDGRQSRGRI